MVNSFAWKPQTVKLQVYAGILCSNIFTMPVVLRDTTQNTCCLRTESWYPQNHATCYTKTQFLIVTMAKTKQCIHNYCLEFCHGQVYLNTTFKSAVCIDSCNSFHFFGKYISLYGKHTPTGIAWAASGVAPQATESNRQKVGSKEQLK